MKKQTQYANRAKAFAPHRNFGPAISEAAEPRCATPSAIKLPDTPRWSEARPRWLLAMKVEFRESFFYEAWIVASDFGTQHSYRIYVKVLDRSQEFRSQELQEFRRKAARQLSGSMCRRSVSLCSFRTEEAKRDASPTSLRR